MKKLLSVVCLIFCGSLYGMQKKAIIFGVTGQDGSYLAELLLSKGYEVHGVKRRSSSFNTSRLNSLYQDSHGENVSFKLHYGDLTDSLNITSLLREIEPDEIYNLGAQSHVRVSFDIPEYTGNCDGLGTLRILEAIRFLGLEQKTKFYQASTSELYGLVQEIPQKETTPFYPRSPYAVAKIYGYWITVNYRESYNMFACNGILFNHESPRRGETFVTKKISMAIAKIKYGLQDCLYLGNMDSKRDWGYAADYVEAMWMMLQQDKPQDFVIATGETHTVRECVEVACKEAGIALTWQGSGLDEVGINASGKTIVKIDPRYYRPAEVEFLLGDPSKAEKELGWKPKVCFKELVKRMVQFDLEQCCMSNNVRRNKE